MRLSQWSGWRPTPVRRLVEHWCKSEQALHSATSPFSASSVLPARARCTLLCTSSLAFKALQAWVLWVIRQSTAALKALKAKAKQNPKPGQESPQPAPGKKPSYNVSLQGWLVTDGIVVVYQSSICQPQASRTHRQPRYPFWPPSWSQLMLCSALTAASNTACPRPPNRVAGGGLGHGESQQLLCGLLTAVLAQETSLFA